MLQNLIFPKKGICEESELYYHIREGKAVLQENGLYLEQGVIIDFFTYFNSFSAGKWQEYTDAGKTEAVLWCDGKYQMTLYRARLQGEESVYIEKVAEGTDSIHFLCDSADWIYYIEVEALENVLILGGGYRVKEIVRKNEVNLAIGICTYRREEFVKRTIQNLQSQILENSESELYGHVHVFVSDNGNTLPWEEMSDEFVHVVYNKNAGGAGGFGRCMLETLKRQEQCSFTHILLMDDDIILEPESVFRTYQMLSYLKKEYRGHILGGGMLRMDIPFIQHENGAIWQVDRMKCLKRGYDLSKRLTVIKNEERIPVDYCAWWYCCIPLGDEFSHGFPMPFFIHCDDIEYGLRYDGKNITLNGISVWHDAFVHRRASSMVYYDIRNALICSALHYREFSRIGVKKYIIKNMIGHLLKYRYEDQKLIVKALEDFCKGIDFLISQDPVELHQDIMNMGYKTTDVSDLLKEYHVEDYYTRPELKDLYIQDNASLINKLMLNGWLLPGKRRCIPIPFGARHTEFFRCKKVLLFDPDSQQGFVVERKWKQLFVTLGRCFKTCRMIDRYYEKAVAEWRERGKELTTREFWERYLE